MNSKMRSTLDGLRMIWAIALKDIVDAVKNKLSIGIMIGVAFMMLSSQALSLLVKTRREPAAVIYDRGASAQIRQLVRSRALRLGSSSSLDEMISVVGQSVEPRLGIVIPENFDDLAAEGRNPLEIQGYVPHWASSSTIADLVIYFEENLSVKIGSSIRIQVAGNQVYPDPEETGFSTMISTGIVLGVMTIGLILVPILIIEEKETRTLEALLISPVRPFHLMLGKLFAGLFYALVASLVIFAFSGSWIVHWWVVILAVVLGALCAAVTGLLIGSIFENVATVNLWIGLIITFFLLPVFLWSSIVSKLPGFLQIILPGLPSLAMFQMVGLSLGETVTVNQVLPHIMVMVAFIFMMLGVIGWRIRKLDR